MKRYRTTSLGCLVLGAALAACASGPRPLLRGGLFPSTYAPPVGQNRFKDHHLIITVEKIANGAMATNFFAQVTVRNLGTEVAVFDPAEIEILVPETGLTYEHITKDKTTVTVPLGFNLMGRTTLKPGRTITGSLWFMTPAYKAEAKTVQLSYRDQTLTFPPPVADKASKKDEND